MAELDHYWGADLSVGPTGGLLMASGTREGVQRVLRRLLTNAGAYLWQPAYGAGLPERVGAPFNGNYLTAVIRSQIGLEPAVAANPPPVISVTPLPLGAYAQISYADASTGQTVTTPPFTFTPD